MPTAIWVVIAVIAIAVIVAAVFLARSRARTRGLKRRFGPEYDRAVRQEGGRAAAGAGPAGSRQEGTEREY